MIKEIIEDLSSNNINISKYKRTPKKSGQKEVYFITVSDKEYVLKIINVTPYAIYNEFDDDDPELQKAVEQGVLYLSQRTILEIEMSKKCNILPQMKLMEQLKLLKVEDEYYLYYIEEKFDGSSLKYSDNYTLEQVNEFILQLVEQIIIMHKEHYVHRDIKPDNIIYNSTNNKYSLIDGGICKNTDEDYKLTVTDKPLGTPRYMAPEQVRVSPNEKWNFQTDLFPLGLIAIEMFVPELRTQSNEDLRDLHYDLKKWQEHSKSDSEIQYFKKVIVNLSQATRALRFNNLEKLRDELLKWKEELK